VRINLCLCAEHGTIRDANKTYDQTTYGSVEFALQLHECTTHVEFDKLAVLSHNGLVAARITNLQNRKRLALPSGTWDFLDCMKKLCDMHSFCECYFHNDSGLNFI
jgi:hypothetical protein